MSRWLAVVNPMAGRKATPASRIADVLDAAGVEADVEAPGSVAEMSRLVSDELASGRKRFAVAGGDGTVNVVVNALLSSDVSASPIIGLLPTGTGCDLLRTFGLPQDLEGAVQHLTGDQLYPIDVAVLEGAWGRRYFVNVAQVGVGAAAAETATRMSRRLGASRYPLAFARRLPRFAPADVVVQTERRTYESRALAVILANAQFFAGGWNVAPRATLIDGVVDVQIIDTLKRRAPALVPKIVRGTHLRDRAVRRFSAGEFTITTSVPWPLEADGDYIGNTPVSGHVVGAAVQLKI